MDSLIFFLKQSSQKEAYKNGETLAVNYFQVGKGPRMCWHVPQLVQTQKPLEELLNFHKDHLGTRPPIFSPCAVPFTYKCSHAIPSCQNFTYHLWCTQLSKFFMEYSTTPNSVYSSTRYRLSLASSPLHMLILIFWPSQWYIQYYSCFNQGRNVSWSPRV